MRLSLRARFARANLLQATVNSERKVTKRTPPRPVCPAGSLTIQLCLRATLTRRPGSTRLNSTSMSTIFLFFGPTKGECLGKLHGERTPPVKLRSLDGAQRNPGISSSIEQPRIPLRYIRATGMRSTSARDAFFGLRFSCVQKR